MTGLLMAGCGIKLFRWERDLIILTDGPGCGIVLKLTAGCGMKKGKSHVTDMITQRTETLTKRDRDTYSDLGGMAGRLRDTG